MEPKNVIMPHAPFKRTSVFLNNNLFLLHKYENENRVYQVNCAGTGIEL